MFKMVRSKTMYVNFTPKYIKNRFIPKKNKDCEKMNMSV